MHRLIISLVIMMALPSSTLLSAEPLDALVDNYLDSYFRMFPTLATAAGRHDRDSELEDFSPANLMAWEEFNRTTQAKLLKMMNVPGLSLDDRLDAEALAAQIERELNVQATLRRPERDPLYWSSVIANATVFLLVRDDLPLSDRQERARARARLLPRLAQQARKTFAQADRSQVAAEFCQIAAQQVRASGKFYGEGFPLAVGGGNEARKEGTATAAALTELADAWEDLGKRATGSPRLGAGYATVFRLGTGVKEPVDALLKRAQDDLVLKRHEAAAYGRKVWPDLIPKETAPADDIKLLRRLFDRVAADRDKNVEESLAEWKTNVQAIEAFVREKNIITLPDPLTLLVERSPSFFIGQSVGGVYPAGPYAPEAKTILFIPAPPGRATPAEQDAFFRDFNRNFNKMIVPHELIPGHYVQLKIAARQSHKVRAIFPDPVYVEGWGTFCERLLLDQGWGGPLSRLAHLKKQLENIARTIVDIRVHTQNLPRDEVLRFVKEEALQDDQFASNMWTRTLTSSPQITTYYLGYSKVNEVYAATRAKEGPNFDLHRFMDGMMELGPVELHHYLERILKAGKNGKSRN